MNRSRHRKRNDKSAAADEPASATRPRTWGGAALDAIPSLLAAVACGLAWLDPQMLGFDLLRTVAPLFFIELPLAVVFASADARRVPGEFLSHRAKLAFILLPTSLLGLLCWYLFGATGLIAIVWLGATALWRLLSENEDDKPPPTGRWLIVRHRKHGESWTVRKRPAKKDLGDAWVIPLAHDQYLPAATIVAWFGLVVILFTGADIPPGGALPAYAEAFGWTDTPIGSVIPAHEALAAGLALFALRTLGFFDDVGEDMRPVAIEQDEVLREIVDKVERKRR
jgi:hypothetical protein